MCLRSLAAGESVQVAGQSVNVAEAIPAGHKMALRPHAVGQPVIKFGCPIGVTATDIAVGRHVHSHNMRCTHDLASVELASYLPPAPQPDRQYTFEGYRRPSGQVGTRNYLAVISSVNCSASVARMIARHFDAGRLQEFPNVDGVISFRHESGCGMAWEGAPSNLSRVLGAMARHANVGGCLLVGLGCEQGTLDHLIESQQLHQLTLPDGRAAGSGSGGMPVLNIQESGGTRRTIQRGIDIVQEMLPRVNAAQRSTVSASHLILATECGGSDGYSGITANPALGVAADLLVGCGGTVVLSETSEIYGAEHLLMQRARTPEIARKLLERLRWWKEYCGHYGEQFGNNPSVGNKAGGLTTITEKSLGAVAKGGSTTLEAVYEYAEKITQPGLVVMDTPGYDPASVTGMVAGGATLVAFTTGRGSCFGFKPAPSFKIASNSALFQRLSEDMDFNAGQVIEGRSVEEVGRELFLALLATASGQPTHSEQLGVGDEEFVPWLVGPVL